MNSALLDKIYDTFNFGVLIEDKDRKILYTNECFRDYMQLSIDAESIKGTNTLDLAELGKHLFRNPNALIIDCKELPEKAVFNEEIIELENGKYYKRKYSPVFENQTLQLHIWTFEDISSEIESQLLAIYQNNFYLKVLDEIPADLVVFNNKHQYLYINRVAISDEDTRKWLIMKDDFEYCVYRNVDIKKALERRAYFNEAVATKKPVQLIDNIVQKDGKLKYVLRIYHPIFDSNDDLELVVGYGIDITQQEENNKIVEHEKARITNVVNELKEGVFQIDLNGKVLSYNKSVVDLLGVNYLDDPKDFLFNMLEGVSSENKKQILIDFRCASKHKEVRNGVFKITNKLNETKIIDYHIWYSSTEVDGETLIGSLSDITIQEAHEEYLMKNIQKEKDLNILKSKFINITSHELRTPLSVILSSSEIIDLILSKPADYTNIDPKTFLANIMDEVLHINNILNELLVASQIELGQIKLKANSIHIQAFIEKVSVGFLPYKDGRFLNIQIDESINEVVIDPDLLKHAITNLLSNAFKYSPNKKEPDLLVVIENNHLVFKIKDYGIGIPANEKNKLFQTFYRASNAGNISGTGVGLVVVDYAIKEHNGKVKFETEVNEGTIFEVHIPFN